MEQKLDKVPFDLELAKEISNGTKEGRIVTRKGDSVRILCWDKKDKTYPIVALVDNGSEEDFKTYTNEGVWNTDKSCTLMNYNLMLEIPEYLTFKNGDIVKLSNDTSAWLSIIRDIDLVDNGRGDKLYVTNDYVSIMINGGDGHVYIDDHSDVGTTVEKATEDEIKTLIDALKASKEPKAEVYLKHFFGIEEKPKCEFKPKDWVLCYSAGWNLCQFSHTKLRDIDNKLMYVTVGGIAYEQCIPYNEQTAHLLRTTDDWEE